MEAPSVMISFRLTEEESLELDRRIGFDGMRNRSDVLRRALQKLLDETAAPGERRITIPVGTVVAQQIKVLKEMGIDSTSAANQGIGMVLKQQTAEMKEALEGGLTLLEEVEQRGQHQDHTE